MSNAIAVVILVIGILALFAAAGALYAVGRKAGNRTVPAPQEIAANSCVKPPPASLLGPIAKSSPNTGEKTPWAPPPMRVPQIGCP